MKTSKIKKAGLVFTSLTVAVITLFSGCGKQPETKPVAAEGLKCIYDTEFGGVFLGISIDEFNALGFEFGDSVKVSFSNGYNMDDLPYFNGYYTPVGEPLVAGYPGYEYLTVAMSSGGDMWKKAGLDENCTASVTLNEHGRYSEIQNARNIHYNDERELYASDEVFANFRSVKAGGIGEGVLYRSASPCDNQHNRATYTDKLMKQAGVRFILDLADNEEKIAGYMAKPDFSCPYFTELYESGNVSPIALNMDYRSDEFRAKVAGGFVKMAESDGPYLVHCTEGKDRTGFVCMLLETLMGASYEEIEADYMKTYDNYYGISKTSDKAKYDIISENLLVPMIKSIVNDESADIRSADLSKCAEKVLLSAGMTDEQIALLRQKLHG